MKLFIAHASAFPYEEKVYAPVRGLCERDGHEAVFPQDGAYGPRNWRESITGADAFVLDASVPSTGAGIEAGWASAAGVPVIAVHEKGSVPSTVVAYIAAAIVEYDGPEDLSAKLGRALASLSERA